MQTLKLSVKFTREPIVYYKLDIDLSRQNIVTRTREIPEYTIETTADLNSLYGIDVEKMLLENLYD